MEKYLSLLIEQFKQANNIKNVDINSQAFISEFSVREKLPDGQTRKRMIPRKGKRTEKMTIQTIRAAKALAMIPIKRMILMRSGLRLWKRSWLSMRLTKTRQSAWRILTLLWQSTRFRLSSVIASPNPYPMMRI